MRQLNHFIHRKFGDSYQTLVPYAGSGEYCTLDSFVDFSRTYIICLFTSFASPLIFFLHLFPYLSVPLLIFSFENRPTPFPGCRWKEATKPGLFVSSFSLFYVIVFLFCLMHDYLCSVSLDLLYIFVVISSGF